MIMTSEYDSQNDALQILLSIQFESLQNDVCAMHDDLYSHHIQTHAKFSTNNTSVTKN